LLDSVLSFDGISQDMEKRPSRIAGPLLASMLVVLYGAIGAAVLIAGGGGNPLTALLILGGVLILFGLFAYFIQSIPRSPMDSAYSWIRSRQARPDDLYLPKIRRSRQHYGENAPPTVDDVRELKEGLNNWVPSNVSGRRKSR
jgi:hypothetical protein